MTQTAVFSGGFPKSARLLKRRDFKFDHFKLYRGTFFNFIFTTEGHQRLGISISKKIMRKAIARNRVRRLVKEAFRNKINGFSGIDVHVVGQSTLTDHWPHLKRQDVESEFTKVARNLGHNRTGQ